MAIVLLVMMGITPFLKWRGKPAQATGKIFAACLGGAVVLGLLLTLANSFFYGESLKAPVDAIVRSNPSAYAAPASPRPSGILLNGRTNALGAVIPANGAKAPAGVDNFDVPQVPSTTRQAWTGALHIKHGDAFPFLAIAAFFCILANGFMIYRVTGFTKRSWLPAGGYLTHIGIGVLLTGVITSLNYGGDAILNLDAGQMGNPVGQSVNYTGGSSVNAFGHTFTFQGYDIIQNGHTAVMRIAVQTGDETFVAKPRLTIARDGSQVHFPSIRKYLTEDLYVSPIKLPGAQQDPNQEFRFHTLITVTHGSQSFVVNPGVSFLMSGEVKPTDTPMLPGSHYQVVIQTLETPTRDAPDRPAVLDIALVREGTFQNSKSGPSTIRLPRGKTVSYKGYTFRFDKFNVDKKTQDQVKAEQAEARLAQVEVSTKPLIDLVWLGTFLIIGGGLLALRRRILEARHHRDQAAGE